MIRITGIKQNNLNLMVDGERVGTLDVDHNKIYLDYTEEEWTNNTNIDIAFEVADYYDELDVIDDTVVPTVEYEVIFKEW